MPLLRGRWSSPGSRLTGLAAGLLVGLSLVANPWTQLVRIGQGPSRGAALLGTVVMAAALLDRWKPMRIFVRYGCWAAALGYVSAAVFGARPAAGLLVVAGGYLGVSALLASKPVRSWFREPRNEWGAPPEDRPAEPAEPMLPMEGWLRREPNEWGDAAEPVVTSSPLLPAEKVEPGIPGVQRAGGSGVREARSSRSPEERK